MVRARILCVVLLAFGVGLGLGAPVAAAVPDSHPHEHQGTPGEPRWEGSPEGKAYSEANHHLTGVLVLLIGASELLAALGIGVGVAAWSRFLLPAAMLLAGAFLMMWSDHDAWPVGRLTFTETLFGGDRELLQHKLYAVLLVTVGTIEWWRRSGELSHAVWAVPLPLFAVVGGLMLFGHSHGAHPGAAKIAWHHTVMGVMAVGAGACKLARQVGFGATARSPWELAWAALILLIGVDLLFYSE